MSFLESRMNNNKDPAGWVYSWKEFQDDLNPEKTFKKATIFFKFLGQGFFSLFRQLSQNLGLQEISGFSSSLIYSVKHIRATALMCCDTIPAVPVCMYDPPVLSSGPPVSLSSCSPVLMSFSPPALLSSCHHVVLSS